MLATRVFSIPQACFPMANCLLRLCQKLRNISSALSTLSAAIVARGAVLDYWDAFPFVFFAGSAKRAAQGYTTRRSKGIFHVPKLPNQVFVTPGYFVNKLNDVIWI